MDKTRDSTNSKIWPDSTCAISVRRKGQILLVVESLVLSTTYVAIRKLANCANNETCLIIFIGSDNSYPTKIEMGDPQCT